jgi:hypothetical protein
MIPFSADAALPAARSCTSLPALARVPAAEGSARQSGAGERDRALARTKIAADHTLFRRRGVASRALLHVFAGLGARTRCGSALVVKELLLCISQKKGEVRQCYEKHRNRLHLSNASKQSHLHCSRLVNNPDAFPMVICKAFELQSQRYAYAYIRRL